MQVLLSNKDELPTRGMARIELSMVSGGNFGLVYKLEYINYSVLSFFSDRENFPQYYPGQNLASHQFWSIDTSCKLLFILGFRLA